MSRDDGQEPVTDEAMGQLLRVGIGGAAVAKPPISYDPRLAPQSDEEVLRTQLMARQPRQTQLDGEEDGGMLGGGGETNVPSFKKPTARMTEIEQRKQEKRHRHDGGAPQAQKEEPVNQQQTQDQQPNPAFAVLEAVRSIDRRDAAKNQPEDFAAVEEAVRRLSGANLTFPLFALILPRVVEGNLNPQAGHAYVDALLSTGRITEEDERMYRSPAVNAQRMHNLWSDPKSGVGLEDFGELGLATLLVDDQGEPRVNRRGAAMIRYVFSNAARDEAASTLRASHNMLAANILGGERSPAGSRTLAGVLLARHRSVSEPAADVVVAAKEGNGGA